MANRAKVLETLDQYFETKGRVLKQQEYIREVNPPIRLQQIRNIFGCWNTMEKLLMARRQRDEDAITDVSQVLEARNRAANEERQRWIEASENQDAKAEREAQAQYVAEQLARNAATADGAVAGENLTPEGLKKAAEAKVAAQATGHATDGGSQGQPSIATEAALGNGKTETKLAAKK